MKNPLASFVRALVDVFVISLVRFKPAPRLWARNLVAANTAGLFFLPRLEVLVLWTSIILGLTFMSLVYERRGFVRLLGAGHALWIFVLPWLAWRFFHLPAGAELLFRAWLAWAVLTDAVSLAIDARDVLLYVKGERAPLYKI